MLDRFYVYETVCLVNGKKYIGSYKTNSWGSKTAYLGSSRQLLEDLKKYGRGNFKKKILFSFNSLEDAFKKEEELVSQDICDNKNYYNIVRGGRSLEGEKRYMGYRNPDFENRWVFIYSKVKSTALYYLLSTNLPDRLIIKIIKRDFGVSIKIDRLIKYLEHLGLLTSIKRIKTKDYFTIGSGVQFAVKTVFKETNIIKKYKVYKKDFVDNLNEFIKLTSDRTISDSMIYNEYIVNDIGEKFFSRVKYYKYLGILTQKEQIRIGIRGKLPNAQRATGLKTLFEVHPQKLFCIEIRKEGIYEKCFYFDGKTFSEVKS